MSVSRVWVVLLIVAAVRGRTRGGGPSAGLSYVFLVVGVVVNLIVVTIVGFVQGGGATFVVVFAVEGGSLRSSPGRSWCPSFTAS